MPGIELAPMVLAILLLIAGYMFRRYRWFPRGTAWCFAGSAFFAMFGLTPLLFAVVQAAASVKGMFILLGVLLVTGWVFAAEAVLARRYHPVGTPFTSIAFGAVAAVVYADWKYLGANAKTLLPATRAGMKSVVAQVNSGHAANALTAAQKDKWLLTGAILLIVVFFWLRWSHRRHGAARRPKPLMQGGGAGGGVLSGLISRVKAAAGGGSGPGGGGRKGRQPAVRGRYPGPRGPRGLPPGEEF